MKRSTLLGLIVLVGALVFAVAGGEYGTLDWLELRRQERDEARAIADLTVEVDSLKRYARAVETDRRLMEQIAREEFGMIRKGEFLYRLQQDTTH
ncbi:MAG TPA: septum formation initiator family protein [Gemmatimonadales bacterium]|nr:septum formation initiator family protein [Gemmatimonadales bacterium]